MLRLALLLFYSFSLLLSDLPGVNADPRNITIDDENGDEAGNGTVQYNAAGQVNWNFGPNCTTCEVAVNASQTLDNSWHETTVLSNNSDLPSLTLTFTGTALYVFGILPNATSGLLTLANMTFTLDGGPPVSFVHEPTSSYIYNAPLFSRSSLPNSQHTCVVTPQSNSYITFDYALYTVDNTTASSSSALPTSTSSVTGSFPPSQSTSTVAQPSQHHTATAAIAGSVIGGVVLVVGVILAFMLVRRCRRGSQRRNEEAPITGQMGKHPDEVNSFQPHMSYTESTEPVAISPTTDASRITNRLAVNPEPRPGTKAAMRRQELVQRIQELEREMPGVNAQQRPVSINASGVSAPEQGGADWKTELEGLRAEVKQLTAQVLPPAYQGHGSDVV